MDEQKPNVKMRLSKDWLLQQAREAGEGLMQRLFGLTSGWAQNRDIVRNNFELGMAHLAQGHINDAVMRFRLVTWLEPENASAWYYLGCSQLAKKKPRAARQSLKKALQYRPDHAEAAYMLAIAGGADTLPTAMPVSLVEVFFDKAAVGYNQEQEERGYQGPVLLAAAIRASVTAGRIDHDILELGVGTGLCGPALRPLAATLTGVDISAPMLAHARALQCYDALIRRELHGFLEEVPAASCDIVLASRTAGYIGELSPLFAHAARVLKTGGLFALTADMLDGDGFALDIAAGYFRFSQRYLQGLAAQYGLQIAVFQQAALYPNEMAWLCVFRK